MEYFDLNSPSIRRINGIYKLIKQASLSLNKETIEFSYSEKELEVIQLELKERGVKKPGEYTVFQSIKLLKELLYEELLDRLECYVESKFSQTRNGTHTTKPKNSINYCLIYFIQFLRQIFILFM